MERVLRVVLVVAYLSLAPSVMAAEIRWSGSSDCRREQEVTEQVESMTDRPLAGISSADFELHVQPAADGQWRVQLKTSQRNGTSSSRSIVGASCSEVTDAAAVAIALAVGPKESSAEPRNDPEAARVGTVSAPAPRIEPRAAPRSRAPLEWTLGLGATLDSSSTPRLAAGAALRLAMGWRATPDSQARWRFELEGALYAPTETTNLRGEGGRFQLGAVAALACGTFPLRVTALLGCAGYELGQLAGEGVGWAVTDSSRRGTLWSAARAELGVLVPLGSSFRFTARLGAALPVARREFVLDGSNLVFRPAAVSARGQLGFELLL